MTGPPLSKSTFARLVGELTHAEFQAFVADLFTARGWEVRLTDDLISLRRNSPAAEQRTVAVWRDGSSVTATAATIDLLVTRTPGAGPAGEAARELGATLIDTTDLYRLFLYGIDRQDADRVFETYFDRRLGSVRQRPAPEATAEPVDGQRARSWRSGPRPGVLAAVVVALGVVVVLGAVSGPLGAFEGDGGPIPPVVPIGTVDPEPDQFSATPVTLPTTVADLGEPDTNRRMVEERYLDLHPTCDRPPSMVVSIILGALRSGQPATEQGIETAWRFAVNPRRSNNGYRLFVEYLNQDQFGPLFDHQAVEYTRPVRHTDSIVTQRVTLTADDRRVDYVFALSKSRVDTDAGCWKLAGIQGPTS